MAFSKCRPARSPDICSGASRKNTLGAFTFALNKQEGPRLAFHMNRGAKSRLVAQSGIQYAMDDPRRSWASLASRKVHWHESPAPALQDRRTGAESLAIDFRMVQPAVPIRIFRSVLPVIVFFIESFCRRRIQIAGRC